MKIIIISCSLHPQSRSNVLARQMVSTLQTQGIRAPLYDLRDYDIDFCDAMTASDKPDAKMIISAIAEADAVLLAVPIYNYDVNAAAKNLLEIGLRAWNNKLVGFMCAAGGRASYMSVMSLANSLMLDFRCLIVPRFVYATGDDFGNDRAEDMYVSSEAVQERITELGQTTLDLMNALQAINQKS